MSSPLQTEQFSQTQTSLQRRQEQRIALRPQRHRRRKESLGFFPRQKLRLPVLRLRMIEATETQRGIALDQLILIAWEKRPQDSEHILDRVAGQLSLGDQLRKMILHRSPRDGVQEPDWAPSLFLAFCTAKFLYPDSSPYVQVAERLKIQRLVCG